MSDGASGNSLVSLFSDGSESFGNELLLAGLNALADGVILIGPDSRVAFWNRAMQEMAGMDSVVAQGRLLEELFPAQAGGRLVEAVSWALRNGLPSMLSSALNRQPLPLQHGGQQIKQSVYVTPLRDRIGRQGCLVCIRDVTALVEKDQLLRRRAQQLQESLLAIEQTRDAAESANRAKSAFLANMSHELRTPLHAILGFTEVLLHDVSLNIRQRESLMNIHRSGNHLLGLINDVLEVAKIEAGKLKVEPAPLDFHALIRDVVEMLRIPAENRGLQLQIATSSRFPRFVVGDEAKLRSVITNLLSNAVKATSRGGIILRLDASVDNSSLVVIEVEDTGCGIAPEEQQRIFEPFVQGVAQGAQQGTGLGLAITRQFVELMGGHLSLSSCLGQGTTFRVELPMSLASQEEVSRLALPQGVALRLQPGEPARRILIALQGEEATQLLMGLLEGMGMSVRAAASPAELEGICAEWQPELLILDLALPGLDDLSLVQRLRSGVLDNSARRLVALLHSSASDVLERYESLAFDGVLVKPVLLEHLYPLLASLLGLKFEQIVERTLPGQQEIPVGALKALAPALRQELQRALDWLDNEAISGVVETISQSDPVLGAALRERARTYDYPAILNALGAEPAVNDEHSSQCNAGR